MAMKRRTSNKNPPIFSHEFVIQNHADIVACVAMVFVLGLMFQVTSAWASKFIALHHNITRQVPKGPQGQMTDVTLYVSGPTDLDAIFFYLLIAVVMHQIIQEYLLDKVNRKLHLSKIKHAKFNESGQLVCFYMVSLVWAADILYREQLFRPMLLWEGYPHVYMTSMFKFFFIIQLSYWLHVFPELYFQKVKYEDMLPRIQYACLYLAFIGGAYIMNFTRVALWLLVLHYLAEALFHAGRLLTYSDKTEYTKPMYLLHDAVFVLSRLGSIALAIVVFCFSLPDVKADVKAGEELKGNYNTFVFRTVAMLAIIVLQAWLLYNFFLFQIRRWREKASNPTTSSSGKSSVQARRKTQQEKAKQRKEAKPRKDDSGAGDEDELPEVDQNTKKTLRQRK